MITFDIKIKEGVILPKYETKLSSGMDVRAFIDSQIDIPPGEFRLIKTGISMEIPQGFELQIRPRSGLAIKNGVTVLNSPGTVDSDYRGDIGVILINHSKDTFTVSPQDRIAQFVFSRYSVASFNQVESLSETDRGEGGFGSSGVK